VRVSRPVAILTEENRRNLEAGGRETRLDVFDDSMVAIATGGSEFYTKVDDRGAAARHVLAMRLAAEYTRTPLPKGAFRVNQ
jgi:hypothetical protein